MCSGGTRSGAQRVPDEKGGKALGEAARMLDLWEVRRAREHTSLGVRQPRKQPAMDLTKAIPEPLAFPAKDTEHRVGDLLRLSRGEVPGQLRREFGLEPGSPSPPLGESAAAPAMKVLPTPGSRSLGTRSRSQPSLVPHSVARPRASASRYGPPLGTNHHSRLDESPRRDDGPGCRVPAGGRYCRRTSARRIVPAARLRAPATPGSQPPVVRCWWGQPSGCSPHSRDGGR